MIPPGNLSSTPRGSRPPLERGLLIAVPVSVAVVFLLWTGVVPGLYPASPIRWTEEAPGCLHSGETLPSVEYRFPLWATVHVQWTATGDVSFLSWGYTYWGNAIAGISQLGTSGNFSFVSDGDTLVFAPSALPINITCPSVSVTMEITYSV